MHWIYLTESFLTNWSTVPIDLLQVNAMCTWHEPMDAVDGNRFPFTITDITRKHKILHHLKFLIEIRKARQGQNVMSRTVVKQDVRCFAHFQKWVTCKLYSWYTFLIIVQLITSTVTWQVEFLIFSIYVHWVSLGCDKRSIALFFRFGPEFRVLYVFPNRVFIYI